MIAEYCSGTSRRDSVAEEILKAVVKKCPLSFAMELPELACKSAESLWGQRKMYQAADAGCTGAR